MKPVDNIVLIGHNAFLVDTPRLLRNRGCQFSNQLQEMKVLFTNKSTKERFEILAKQQIRFCLQSIVQL